LTRRDIDRRRGRPRRADIGNRGDRNHHKIAHYEARHEIFRIRAIGSLRRLEYALDPSRGFDRLALTTGAIVRAAEFWAMVRHSGIPTSSPDALDAILGGKSALAGQLPDTVAIAMMNLAHWNRFPGIHTRTWDRAR
jgi:hypothetical protein